jgi:stringent starvation protein A
VVLRRSGLVLFCGAEDPWSHRTRLVLAEKNVPLEIVNVEAGRYPEDLLDLNPYQSLPTLVDRELVLYDSRVIFEYVDERYPAPPLLPVDPSSRGQVRVALYRFERDWYPLAATLAAGTRGAGVAADAFDQARRELRELVLQTAPLFRTQRFVLGEEYSILDATLAPILWRLPQFGVELTRDAEGLMRYAQRLFARPAFRSTLVRDSQPVVSE